MIQPVLSNRIFQNITTKTCASQRTYLGLVSIAPPWAFRSQAIASASRGFSSCKFPTALSLKKMVRYHHSSIRANEIEENSERSRLRPWIVVLGIATVATTVASYLAGEDEVELVGRLGSHFFDTEQYAEALECHQKSLKMREKELPPDHPDLATSINSVGIRLFVLGRNAEALEYIEKAMKIREKVLPADHLDLAMSYNDMSINLFRLERHAEALEYAQKALAIKEKVLQPNHYYLAQSHLSMSNILIHLGQSTEALECIQKASAIVEKTFCKDLTLAMLHFHLGANLFILAQHTEALKQHEKALEVIATLKNPMLQINFLRHFTFSLYAQFEDTSLRESSKEKILTLYIPILGENHPLIQEIQNTSQVHDSLTWTKPRRRDS